MVDEVASLQAAAHGDGVAVRWLLDTAAPVVYGYVFARVGGDEDAAADLLQDTFLEAMRSADSFRGDSALTTWLCAIASRRLARHYEVERRQQEARRQLRVVPAEPIADDTDAVAERDRVTRALGRLAPDHRRVLVLKYLDGHAVADIAEEIGRSRVQVQSLLQRARDALRTELGATS